MRWPAQLFLVLCTITALVGADVLSVLLSRVPSMPWCSFAPAAAVTSS